MFIKITNKFMKAEKKLITFVFGTRPEAIKMAPVIKKFKGSNEFNVEIVLTGQHDELIKPVMDFFKLKEDINFKCMYKGQSLDEITTKILLKLTNYLNLKNPSLIFVQGDTTSAMASSMASFYKKIPVSHIEAGLRTDDIYSPFPEEANRRIISQLATLHFTPTKSAYENLKKDGIRKNVFISGNTITDALLEVTNKETKLIVDKLDIEKDDYVLITVHRRENWGKALIQIAESILKISNQHQKLKFIIPLHKNPLVKDPLTKLLGNSNNILLVDNLPYLKFINLLKNAKFVLTDSGGIQEEAAILGKPTLILRNNTERPEVLYEGNAFLVGTEEKNIISEFNSLLIDRKKYQSMTIQNKSFGDGNASQLILEKTIEFLEKLY